MPFDPAIHHRHTIRLQDYDYTCAGAYFITLVTAGRECIFSAIDGGEMQLSQIGKIARQEWENLPVRFPGLSLGEYVIMPNHIHGIMCIAVNATHNVGATHANPKRITPGKLTDPTEYFAGNSGSPLPDPPGPKPGSIGAIIGQFKSRVTKRVWADKQRKGIPLWLRNYYEHIIRDEQDYERIANYILANPANWLMDEENQSPR